MTRIAIAVVAILLSALAVSAQQAADTNRAAAIHRGKAKVRAGLILLGVGAVMLPVTATRGAGSQGPIMTAGFGTATVGGALVWSGVVQQRQATQTVKAFTVAVGPRRSAAIRWNW